VRLYLEDRGFEAVRTLAATANIASAILGRAETIAAFHRKVREGAFRAKDLRVLISRFDGDCNLGGYTWLPVAASVVKRLTERFLALPPAVPLCAADALHLACAAENRFRAIYSNDRRLLDAAPHFGLRGIDVIN
jgi:predicted nucleic acid-binding protein